MDIFTRNIVSSDNATLANIIRRSMEEFGVNKPGTVYFDETTDHLSDVFQSNPKSKYFIAESHGKIVGGAGIYPTKGLPDGVCELVKMYLSKEARGLGLGRMLIEKCIDSAKQLGYTKIYLESMPELKKALSVYEKFGFTYLDGPMGDSGHGYCAIWMLKEI